MTSDLHQARSSRVVLIVSGLAIALAFTGAAILTQMSGCCGGAPTHGCKFIESNDAAPDMASDAPMSCGIGPPCEPGQTTCCVELDPPNAHCIPLSAICKGVTGSCAGDSDCPAGAGQHCCGSLNTFSIQCEASCTGDYKTDHTLRICRSDNECAPDRPTCGALTTMGLTFFACTN